MSAGAQLWRHIVSRVEAVPRRNVAKPSPPRIVNSVPQPALSLVHQLFFPTAALKRTSVLFASVDSQSKASGICEQIAIGLANYSGEMVGIVEAGDANDLLPLKKHPSNTARSVWQACSVPVAEHVRRIPAALLFDGQNPDASVSGDPLKHLRSAFSHFVLSAAIHDSEMPALSRMCDGVVLVLTANTTRKQAALRAKEQLSNYGVTLLGTVLDQRTLPIPESIYRYL